MKIETQSNQMITRFAKGDRKADWNLTDPVMVEGKAEPRVPALLLIDSQEDFRAQYNIGIPKMQRVLEFFRERCFPVIFKLWVLSGNSSAQSRQISNRFGKTRLQKITCKHPLPIKELAPRTQAEARRTMLTYHYSSFHQNIRLLRLLRGWNVNTIVLAGGFSEHCSECQQDLSLPLFLSSKINGIVY